MPSSDPSSVAWQVAQLASADHVKSTVMEASFASGPSWAVGAQPAPAATAASRHTAHTADAMPAFTFLMGYLPRW